jgi:hypothetical protein
VPGVVELFSDAAPLLAPWREKNEGHKLKLLVMALRLDCPWFWFKRGRKQVYGSVVFYLCNCRLG